MNCFNHISITLTPTPFIYFAEAQTMMSKIQILPYRFHTLVSRFSSLFFSEHYPLGLGYEVHLLKMSFSLQNYRKF
jgi:hypothetical protein